MKKIDKIEQILVILKSFYEENKELLNLEIPVEKWDEKNILFSTNKSMRGKIYFKVNEMIFEFIESSWWSGYKNFKSTILYSSQRWKKKVLNKLDFGFPFDSKGEMIYKKIPVLSISIEKVNNLYKLEIANKKRTDIIRKKEKFNNLIEKSISKLDKDGNGEIDLIDGDSFDKLLSKNQKRIIEIDKNHIQKFVKIALYLKTKKSNTQRIFISLRKTNNTVELNELLKLLNNQVHTYELLVFHSISMITSLIESDLITFYEIYESFDQLGVFNSNWENEVSNKLTDIGDGIIQLMYLIHKMEYNIVNSLDTLTYVTQDSFSELKHSITSQLSSIDSSINFNNLLTGIQTYQMYKINQNTKRIN
jgi:hypothetical protein